MFGRERTAAHVDFVRRVTTWQASGPLAVARLTQGISPKHCASARRPGGDCWRLSDSRKSPAAAGRHLVPGHRQPPGELPRAAKRCLTPDGDEICVARPRFPPRRSSLIRERRDPCLDLRLQSPSPKSGLAPCQIRRGETPCASGATKVRSTTDASLGEVARPESMRAAA